MAIKKSIWRGSFARKSFPGLPCPQCDAGKLKLIESSFYMEEPKYSADMHNHNDWDPDWIINRFSARMQCDEADCGEIALVSGETEVVQSYIDDDDGYGGWGLEEVLRPRSIFPAPPLFRIPKKVPHLVKEQLRLAFQFYWADLAAAVGRLRTAVEFMLDDQQIPSQKLSKKGKTLRMDLAERIEVFAATATGDESKEALHGLRYIGNLGTHGSSVAEEPLFDAIDVLEDVLLGIYEKQSIKAKVRKLNEKKGKY